MKTTMLQIRRIARSGRSLVLTFPRSFARALGVERGDLVLCEVEGSRLMVRRIDPAQLAAVVNERRSRAAATEDEA